jgi:hypothetical protein
MARPFVERFEGPDLDRDRWLPHYLPQWSSRAASAATYEVADSGLRLTIPAGQGRWCPRTHAEPLRVSGIQSGVFSGPRGSTIGQQPFLDGQVVEEEQPAWWGWTPHHGRIEVTARMDLSPRSMASAWLVGLEDSPERCGEICVFEVFGDAVDQHGAAVGSGVHAFRDPALREEFSADHQPIDVSQPHTYAADWRPDGIDFRIDGVLTRTSTQSPAYPMQMMVAVFDFPAKGGAEEQVPGVTVSELRG